MTLARRTLLTAIAGSVDRRSPAFYLLLVQNLERQLRDHIAWAAAVHDEVAAADDFEVLSPLRLSLFSFRHRPAGVTDEAALDEHNEALLRRLNDGGRLYLTRNCVRGRLAIRFVVGQTNTEERHVQAAWAEIQAQARGPVAGPAS